MVIRRVRAPKRVYWSPREIECQERDADRLGGKRYHCIFRGVDELRGGPMRIGLDTLYIHPPDALDLEWHHLDRPPRERFFTISPRTGGMRCRIDIHQQPAWGPAPRFAEYKEVGAVHAVCGSTDADLKRLVHVPGRFVTGDPTDIGIVWTDPRAR